MRIRPSPAVVEARKREIARRYRDQAKRKGWKRLPLTMAALRIAELTTLYARRHGGPVLPDTDDGVLAARIMLHHLARLRDAPGRMRDWLHVCTPWLGLASRERLMREAIECPLRWSADKLAWKLRVTAAERATLGLRTVGAVDMTKAERAAAAKARKRERDRQRRRRQGVKPRAEYEAASTARARPWLLLGMSRAAWYRAGKPAPPPA